MAAEEAREEHDEAIAKRRALENMPDLREHRGAEENEPSQAEFTTVYDAIDQMEARLNEAKGTMFSPSQVKIDRDEFLEQLEALKSMLPIQLERASALMRAAEQRLESAQSQANMIISSAQSRAQDMIAQADEQVKFLTGQENVTQLARDRARSILDKAQASADRLTQGADRYCIGVMNDLMEQLHKVERNVDGGIKVLEDRQQAAAEDLPRLSEDDYPQS